MSNPLSSVPASIRLRTSAIPTVGKMDAGGSLVDALKVDQLLDYAASAAVTGASTAGSNVLVFPVGTNIDDVAPGSVCTSASAGLDSVPVTRLDDGVALAGVRIDSNSKALFVEPNVSVAGIKQKAVVSGTGITAGTQVVATPAQPSAVTQAVTVGIVTVNADTTAGSATVTPASMTGLKVGMRVSSSRVPDGSSYYIIAVGASTVTLNTGVGVTLGTGISTTFIEVSMASTAGIRAGMLQLGAAGGSFLATTLTVAAVPSATTVVMSAAAGHTAGSDAITFYDLVAAATSRVISSTSGTAVATLTEGTTAGLVPGMIFSHPGWVGLRKINAISTSTTFTVATNTEANTASNASSSVSSAETDFGAIFSIGANPTSDTVSGTVTSGPLITLASNAANTVGSTSFAFTGNGKAMANMRDGDFCTIALRADAYHNIFGALGFTSYVMVYGYLRQASAASAQFYLFSAETGGAGVDGPALPASLGDGTSWLYSSSPSTVVIKQSPRLPFAFQNNTTLRGRAARVFSITNPPTAAIAPSLTYCAAAMQLKPSRLGGRLTARPALLMLDASQYVKPKRTGVVARLTAAPSLATIEKPVVVATRSVKGRLTAAPKLTGGYLRAPFQLCRARLYHGPITILRNGEEITGCSSRLTSRVPLAKLTGNEQFRRTPIIRGLFRGRATFVLLGRGLSVRDVVNDCLRVWNLRTTCPSQQDTRERAIADLNAALQLIYSRARRLDYFNSSTITVSVAGNAKSVDLPNTVQTVLGNVRWKATEDAATSNPLVALASYGEVERFATLYGSAASNPVAYHIDRRTQPEANVVKSAVMLAPVPTATVYVAIDVALQAPRYTWRDYEMATPLQLPSTYAELLLMPIVRQRATSHTLFVDEELRSSIEAHYTQAMQRFGLVDSAPNAAAAEQTKVEGT